MNSKIYWLTFVFLLLSLAGCGAAEDTPSDDRGTKELSPVTENTKISDVINEPLFNGYGRLIFPANTSYYSGDTLGNLSLTWYSNIKPARTVEIVNYMREQVAAGNQIFYRIYSDEEISADSRKADTGVFFFRGNSERPDQKRGLHAVGPALTPPACRPFAVCSDAR